jgi:hypothetical protein
MIYSSDITKKSLKMPKGVMILKAVNRRMTVNVIPKRKRTGRSTKHYTEN